MLLIIIFVIILAAGILLWVIGDRKGTDLDMPGAFITIAGGLFLLIAITAFVVTHIGIDAKKAEYDIRYESLTYQWENDFYGNEYGIGKKELVKEIQSWNEDIAGYKKLQRNIWIGVFVPDIYDDYKFIPLDKNSAN
jgi:hypothetical protein